jgi:hypothetical protein
MRESKADRLKIKELAEKYKITPAEVRLIVRSQFEFVRVKTKELNFIDNLSKDMFNSMKTNFTFPALGKLYASHFLYNKIQENKKKNKN